MTCTKRCVARGAYRHRPSAVARSAFWPLGTQRTPLHAAGTSRVRLLWFLRVHRGIIAGMCCFSPAAAPIGFFARIFRPRLEVSGTRIFARVEAGVQHLAYSMSLGTPSDVAMVLPLPVAHGAGESALSFVDLSGYRTIFDDLSQMVMPDAMPLSRGGPNRSAAPRRQLVVHTVGAFDASFVPGIDDFDRLDPRFRLPDEVWSAHREYRERKFGFAVFKLRKSSKAAVQPMALRFPTSEPGSIFFPTLHVHDGRLHPRASFDHWLYHQLPASLPSRRVRPDAIGEIEYRSFGPASNGIKLDRAMGLVAPDERVFAWALRGELANTDTRIAFGETGEQRRAA